MEKPSSGRPIAFASILIVSTFPMISNFIQLKWIVKTTRRGETMSHSGGNKRANGVLINRTYSPRYYREITEWLKIVFL